MKQQRDYVVILLVLLLSSFSSTNAASTVRIFSSLQEMPSQETHYLRKTERHLATTRANYSADIFLQWATDQPMTRANALSVADQAQTFITQNIPSESNGVLEGILALGILSVSVAKQTVLEYPSPSRLWVQLEVEGLVIAETGSSFDSDSFPFTRIVDAAIRVRDNEFQRQVEPLVVVPPLKDSEASSTMDVELLVIVISLSVALALVIMMVVAFIYRKWTDEKDSEIPLGGTRDEAEHAVEDSVDEHSLYTLREAAPPLSRNGSSVVPPSEEENGGNIFNDILGWSFSMSSDGGSLEFDTTSAEDNPQRTRSRYTIENVDDISIGRDVDVFEDKSDKDEDEATYGSFVGFSSYQVGIRPLEPPSTGLEPPSNGLEAEDLVGLEEVDLDTSGRSEKSRLSAADMDEFDDYIANLPSPYQFLTRGSLETKGRRFMV